MNTNKKKKLVSIMLCVAMLAPMASMAMPVGAQGEDTFTSSSVDTQKDIGECSICEAVTGEWVDINGNKYYFLIEDGNEKSQMAVGFVKIDGEEYYFYEDRDKKGQMAVGWRVIDGEEYYFDEDEDRKGQMVVGWCKTEDGSRYYFDEDEDRKGQMARNTDIKIDALTYHFNEEGVCTDCYIEL